MKHQKKLLLIFVLVCAFLMQMANPAPARADDEQPPVQPTDTVTEPPLQPDDGTTPNTPLPDSNSPADSSIPTVDSTPAAADPEPDGMTIAETIAQLPEGTGLVVLDENGEALPLVSIEAVEAMLLSDPMWCPATATIVTASCVNALTVTALLPLISGKTEAGIIYFMPSYTVNDTDFDGTTLGTTANYAITFQGGWDGNTVLGSTISFIGNTDFSNPFSVSWNAPVTVNNFTIIGAAGAGLSVTTTSGGDVSLKEIAADNNTGNGLLVNSDGAIALNNVTASDNSFYGAYLVNTTGNVTLSGTNTFNNNASDGLYVNSGGDIALNDVIVEYNIGDGLYVNSGGAITWNDVNTAYNSGWGAILYATGDVTSSGSSALTVNGETGLYIKSGGAITLNDLQTNGNGGWGTVLYATGNVTLSGANVFWSNHGGDGLYVDSDGDIALNDVTASGNDSGSGAILYAAGNVTLSGTNEFSSNYGGDGLYVDSDGDIALNDVDASDNSNDGAELYAAGNVTLSGTNTFSNNGDDGWYDDGLYVNSGGAITLNDVYASSNFSYGAELYATGNVTLSGTTTFNENWEDGLYIESNDGNITLSNVTAEWNSWNGVTLVSTGNNHANITAASIQYNGWSDVDASWFCGNSVSLFGTYDFYSPQDCFGEEEDAKPVEADSPREQVVNTNTGLEIAFDIDCTLKDVYSIKLPNRDKIKIVCPADGHAVIKRLDNTMLPADLPAGYTYISAFSLEISLPLVGYISSIKGGYVTVAFSLPIVKPGISYAILYWDLGQWQEVQTFMIDTSGKPHIFELDPNRNVVSGMNFVTNDNLPQMEASLNFPGVFVLAEY